MRGEICKVSKYVLPSAGAGLTSQKPFSPSTEQYLRLRYYAETFTRLFLTVRAMRKVEGA